MGKELLKVKIAILYQTNFGRISPGGIQNYIHEMFKSAPEDFEVTFFGVGNLERNLPRLTDTYTKVECKKSFFPLSINFALAVRKLNLEEFDIVMVHRVETLFFMKRNHRFKVVSFAHGGTFNYFKGNKNLIGLIFPLLEIIQLAKSDVFYSVIPSQMQLLVRRSKKIKKAPRVFERDIFQNLETAESAHGIALIGRLSKEKRFDLAIKVIKEAIELSNDPELFSKIYIIGDGQELENLKSLASTLDIETNFLGNLSQISLAEKLKKEVSVVLITSKYEGFPLVLLEATSIGKLCVGLSAPGVTESFSELNQPCFEKRMDLVKFLADWKQQIKVKNQAKLNTNSLDYFFTDLRKLSYDNP